MEAAEGGDGRRRRRRLRRRLQPASLGLPRVAPGRGQALQRRAVPVAQLQRLIWLAGLMALAAAPATDAEIAAATLATWNAANVEHASSELEPGRPRRCVCHDWSAREVPYQEAWDWQRATVAARIAAQDGLGKSSEAASPSGDAGQHDAVMLLQHRPVYTLGSGSSLEHLRFDPTCPPVELVRTERGGEVTYHGPGQLVLYPILDLRHHRQDLHWYLRSLEELVIRALWSAFRINATREDGLTGVWADGGKVAAIGVRVSKWITYHGVAVNVTTALAPYELIVPCGISGRAVNSVKELLRERAHARNKDPRSPECVTSSSNLWPPYCDANDEVLLSVARAHLLEQFAAVFDLELMHSDACMPDSHFLCPSLPARNLDTRR
eukprot:SM000080S22946  [mRNA]  locus=s80:193532:195229:- [translate_table: standard]